MSLNPPNRESEIFDVFLCHNSADKAEVREIAENLIKHGIRPWLDERDIHLGRKWDEEIKEQIPIVPAAIIFYGDNGYGPYQDLNEVVPLKEENKKRGIKLIPVFLPSATAKVQMPEDLNIFQIVDLRKEIPNPMVRILDGIIGDIYPRRFLYSINQVHLEKITAQQRQELLKLSKNTINFWSDEIAPSPNLQRLDSISLSKTIVNDMVSEDFNDLKKLPTKDDKLKVDPIVQTNICLV
jgi:TIR domain